MDTLMSLKTFRQVIESGSFVAAAERLDVSTATVSKHVTHIEKRLGVRLLNRNPRTLSLTESGAMYFERCKTLLDGLHETEAELGSLNTAPRGTLRISAPTWMAEQLAGMLASFRQRYPQIVVDISCEDRTVDLVKEGYDLALCVGAGSLPMGVVARRLQTLEYLIGASRDYLERHPAPTCPEDLASHDCVGVGTMDSWRFTGPDGKLEVPARVVMRYRMMSGVVNAVAAGIGLAPLPRSLFEAPAFKDVLTPVLTQYPLRERTLFLIYAGRKHLPLKMRAFIDFALESFRGLSDESATRALTVCRDVAETDAHRIPTKRRRFSDQSAAIRSYAAITPGPDDAEMRGRRPVVRAAIHTSVRSNT
jgi:DNA-binding transcriptional LysR family regulator